MVNHSGFKPDSRRNPLVICYGYELFSTLKLNVIFRKIIDAL